MTDRYIIGADIGGTNSDAVLVNGQGEIVSAVKTASTEDITQGFKASLRLLLDKASVAPSAIDAVFVGTTHATNALLQRKDLHRVGVIRLAGHYPVTLPAGYDWPKDLKEAILVGMETIGGGYQCDGTMITPFCKEEARRAIQNLLKKGAESLAIVGVFSPLNGDQEKETARLVQEIASTDFPVSLSCEIGGVGFIERENSTLLNAALKKVMRTGFHQLEKSVREMGIEGSLMITQNDGSLIDIDRAVKYPVLTISAGPANSFAGGSKLAKQDNAIVVDIGGTSTDVGLVHNGFAQRSLNSSNIGGVALNFSIPDTLSIALGGGSIIDKTEWSIGPRSVAKSLLSDAQAFGGDQLTLTDAAITMNYAAIPQANPEQISLNQEEATTIFESVQKALDQLIFKMQGEKKALPIILVGGGSGLLPPTPYTIPPHFDVANAYGAALAELTGLIDTVVSLQNRQETLERLSFQAKQKALDQGADPTTLRLVDLQIMPYSYVPGQMARVIVRYSGKRTIAY